MSKFSSIIIVVLVIVLIGAVLIWRYGFKEAEKIITAPGDLEITFQRIVMNWANNYTV